MDHDPHPREHDHHPGDKEQVYPLGHPFGGERDGQQPEPEQQHPGCGEGDPLGQAQYSRYERRAHDEEREPEHVKPHLLRLKALNGEQRAGDRGGEREQDPSRRAALPVRLGDVADGADDVQAAHAPGGDQDDGEGEYHAEAEGYDDVLGARSEADVEALAGEGLAEHAHHQPADPDAEHAAYGARDHGVHRPLEGEHAHQVPPPHPDGPRDAELVLAFGGEHDEDQEDQEHPGGHRELPEEQEDAREGLPALVGLIYGFSLDGLGGEVVLPQDRTESLYRAARAGAALDGRALVGYEDGVDPTLLSHQLLQPLKRHDHGRGGGRVRPTLVDAGHRQLRRLRRGGGGGFLDPVATTGGAGRCSEAGVSARVGARAPGRAGVGLRLRGEGGADNVPLADVEAIGGVGAQVHLVRAEVADAQGLARGGREAVEALHGAFVDAEHADGWLAELRAFSGDGDGLGGERGDAGDAFAARETVADVRGDPLVEVAGALGGRLAEGVSGRRALALGLHLHVHLAEVLQGLQAQGVCQGVAGGEGGGEEHGREHQA